MPQFFYRAIDANGEMIAGQIETASERDAVARLRAQGALPIQIDRRRPGGVVALLNTEITPRQALSERDRVALTRSLATLLGAGVPLDRALEIGRDLGVRPAVRAVAARLLEAVQDGSGLADALDRERSAFPPLYRSVVRAGEAGAALEETLARLADQLEASEARRSELRSALIYPGFLLATSIGSVFVLMSFVVPTFEPLLQEAGVEPPPLTQAIIGLGRFFEAYWWMLLLGALAVLTGLRLALAAPASRLALHALALRLPVTGRIWRKMDTARMARLLGALLQNGVSLTAALPLVRDALGNSAMAAEIARITPEVEAGRGLAAPLAEGGMLPPLALQLAQIGQESGRLTEMLLKAGDIFDAEVKREVDNALALLTPSLILLMGGLVAVIISSILFALFSINELAV